MTGLSWLKGQDCWRRAVSWTEALVEQAVRVREQCRPSRLCLTISLGSQPAWGAGIAGPLIGQPRLYRCITNDHKQLLRTISIYHAVL